MASPTGRHSCPPTICNSTPPLSTSPTTPTAEKNSFGNDAYDCKKPPIIMTKEQALLHRRDPSDIESQICLLFVKILSSSPTNPPNSPLPNKQTPSPVVEQNSSDNDLDDDSERVKRRSINRGFTGEHNPAFQLPKKIETAASKVLLHDLKFT